MKKIALSLLLVLSSGSLFASVLICPSTLTCNYQSGQCDNGQWTLDSSQAIESFNGNQTMQLQAIHARKEGNDYQVNCIYPYGTRSSFSVYTYSNQLDGNWQYSGFGNSNAVCLTPNDPSSCQVEKSFKK